MGVHVARPVVLDACVLVPQSLCDLLLRLAEEPRLYRPVWTEEGGRGSGRTRKSPEPKFAHFTRVWVQHSKGTA